MHDHSILFQALAEPKRLQIVEMLAERGRMSATAIANSFEVSAPAVSQHLKVLKEADLVEVVKEAQKRIYKINTDTFEQLEEWTRRMRKEWEKQFTRLDAVLAKENS